MTLQVRKATFGAELEIGDIDTRVEIPEGNHWCRKDATICNGNGAANDPLKRLNLFGSEIQTRPGRSPEELLEITLEIYRLFPKLEFNYTTNLHVHIRVPGLRDDLKALKKIARYQHKFGLRMFHLIDPLIDPMTLPVSRGVSSLEEDRGAVKRYRRRLVSHWHQVPEYQYSLMEAAQTVDEFFLAHRKPAGGLDLLPSRVTRAGVNLLQLLD